MRRLPHVLGALAIAGVLLGASAPAQAGGWSFGLSAGWYGSSFHVGYRGHHGSFRLDYGAPCYGYGPSVRTRRVSVYTPTRVCYPSYSPAYAYPSRVVVARPACGPVVYVRTVPVRTVRYVSRAVHPRTFYRRVEYR